MSKINVRDRNKNTPGKKPNWEYRFEAAKIDGKRKHISKAGFKTKKEALEAGAAALAEYNNAGNIFSPAEISVADYLNFWLQQYGEMRLAISTRRNYGYVIKNIINPQLGRYRLKNITPDILQDFLINYYKTASSKYVILLVYNVLKSGFKYAVFPLKYIKDNPAAYIQLPLSQLNYKERRAISPELYDVISEHFKGTPDGIAVALGWFCGLRIGEALALTWDDVDFENRRITVNKQQKVINLGTNKSSTVLVPPKCNSSRTIEIGDELLKILKEEKIKQTLDKTKYLGYYNIYTIDETKKLNNGDQITLKELTVDELPSEVKTVPFVCVESNGLLLKIQKLDAHIAAFRKSHPEFDDNFVFHCLRHSHSTLLIENGVNLKVIQERLGHKNAEVTINSYISATSEAKHQAVEVFDTITRCPREK